MAVNWYNLVWWDNTVDDPYVSDSEDLKGVDDWDLTSGQHISNWSSEAWIRCTNSDYDGDPDDVLANHLGVPIYSSRLRRVLDAAGIAGIQYLPIQVLHKDGSEILGYQVANILNKVPALDLEKSAYTRYGDDHFIPERRGQLFTVRKAVLKRDALSGYDIIRLEEWPVYEAASERFKQAFEEARCTGYSFTKLSLS
jgi:hypothetical protein